MARELFLNQQKENLINQAAQKFIALKNKAEFLYLSHSGVVPPIITGKDKARHTSKIKQHSIQLQEIFGKIAQNYMSIHHREFDADLCIESIIDVMPEILKRSGESGNQDNIHKYFDYQSRFIEIGEVEFTNANITGALFYLKSQKEPEERVQGLKVFLEGLKNTVEENEKPIIDKLLNQLGAKEEKGEYSEQLGRFERNEDEDFPKYYQKFLNKQAKDLLDEKSRIINEKSLEQLNLVDIYNQITRAYKKVDDKQLKTAMLVFENALTLMNDHTCSADSQELLKEVIQNTNWLLQAKPNDPEYDDLTKSYNNLLETVNEKASKNGQSGFWKQLGGTMLMFLGVIILIAAIVFAIFTLPGAIATAATIATVYAGFSVSIAAVIAGFSLTTAVVGAFAAFKGVFFATKGERESAKSKSFGYLQKSMAENKKYFYFELGKLREKEEESLKDFLYKVSEIRKSGHAPEDKVKELNNSLSEYLETMRQIARIEKAREGGVSPEEFVIGHEDLVDIIKKSEITKEFVQNDSDQKNIRNINEISCALSFSAFYVQQYQRNFDDYTSACVDRHNQQNPDNQLDLNQVKNDENIIKKLQKGYLDWKLKEHVRGLEEDHGDRKVIQKYKSVIEETFLTSVSQARLNKEIEEKVDFLKEIIGDNRIDGFSELELAFVNNLRETLALENVSNTEKLESIKKLFRPFNQNQESLGNIIEVAFYENTNDERISFKLESITAEFAKINQEDNKLSESQRNFVKNLSNIINDGGMIEDNEGNIQNKVLTNQEKVDRILELAQQAKDDGDVLKPVLKNKKILEVERKLKEPNFDEIFQTIPGFMARVLSGLELVDQRPREEIRNGLQV